MSLFVYCSLGNWRRWVSKLNTQKFVTCHLFQCLLLSLVFTSDGFIVGVVIRSVEWYVVVKIKPMESEAEHRFRLWFRRSWSGENCMVGSRSGRINQSQCLIPGLAIGLFFRFCFRLRQPSFHWIISDGVVNGIGRNGNVPILPTLIPWSLWLHLLLRFSIFTKSCTFFPKWPPF